MVPSMSSIAFWTAGMAVMGILKTIPYWHVLTSHVLFSSMLMVIFSLPTDLTGKICFGRFSRCEKICYLHIIKPCFSPAVCWVNIHLIVLSFMVEDNTLKINIYYFIINDRNNKVSSDNIILLIFSPTEGKNWRQVRGEFGSTPDQKPFTMIRCAGAF